MGNADSTDGRDPLPEATRRLTQFAVLGADEPTYDSLGGSAVADVRVRYRNDAGLMCSVLVCFDDGDVRLHGGEVPADRAQWWEVVDAAEVAVQGGERPTVHGDALPHDVTQECGLTTRDYLDAWLTEQGMGMGAV